MVDGVVMERLREGRRPRTMDCGGGGRRVELRRVGVEMIMVADHAKKNIYTYLLSYLKLIFQPRLVPAYPPPTV